MTSQGWPSRSFVEWVITEAGSARRTPPARSAFCPWRSRACRCSRGPGPNDSGRCPFGGPRSGRSWWVGDRKWMDHFGKVDGLSVDVDWFSYRKSKREIHSEYWHVLTVGWYKSMVCRGQVSWLDDWAFGGIGGKRTLKPPTETWRTNGPTGVAKSLSPVEKYSITGPTVCPQDVSSKTV